MTLTCYFREHMLDKGSEGANIDGCVVEATKCIISYSSNSPVGKHCSMTMVANVKFITSKGTVYAVSQETFIADRPCHQ